MTNDTIGDFLTRIRNATKRKKDNVLMPSSKVIEALASILKEEGFITDFKVVKDENDVQDSLEVSLKYVAGQSAISDLLRVSKPGIRKYRSYRDIKPIRRGMGISIYTTSKGVITGEKARELKVGGEYICEIY